MRHTVLLKRTHRLGGDVKSNKGSVIIISDCPETAVRVALRDISDSQINLATFGDSGTNDGEYKVEVVSVTDAAGNITHSESNFSWLNKRN